MKSGREHRVPLSDRAVAVFDEASREVCELALARVNNDRTEAAYRRRPVRPPQDASAAVG